MPTPYSPTTPRQRTALTLVAFVVSLALMASVLMLFNDGHPPWDTSMARAVPPCTAQAQRAKLCRPGTTTAAAPEASAPVAQRPAVGSPLAQQ